MKPCGVITLMSDFGIQDSYVAEMKGVLLSLNPRAQVVDLGHLIPAQETSVASFRLWRAYRHFPKGTIHLAVVDPGVGTSRKLLLAVSADYFFLAPDNGLLSPILQETKTTCYVLNGPRWRRGSGSTFDGRDRLAPAAAFLSLGKSPKKLGRPLRQVIRRPLWAVSKRKGLLEGKIIDIDRFGNLITNIRASYLTSKRNIRVNYRRLRLSTLKKTYGPGKHRPMALMGSAGVLEIALPQGNAQKFLRGSVGQKVTVHYE